MPADPDGRPPAAVPSASEVVKQVRDGFDDGLLRDVAARKAQLHQLRRLLVEQEDRLLAALAADMGKPPIEGYATDLGFTVSEITHLLKHLDRWVRPRSVRLPAVTRPGRAEIRPEPLGVALVIAPWNYPVQLLLAPAAAALAAGNALVLKPSEISAHTAELLAELVPRYLDERVVAIVTGGADETTAPPSGSTTSTCPANRRSAVVRGQAPHAGHARARRQEPGHRGRRRPPGGDGTTPRVGQVPERRPDVRGPGLRARRPLRRGAAAAGAGGGRRPLLRPGSARVAGLRPDRQRVPLRPADRPARRRRLPRGRRRRRTGPRHPLPRADGARGRGSRRGGDGRGGLRPDPAVLAVDDVDEAVAFVNRRDNPLALYAFGGQAATDRVVERTSAGGVCVNHAVLQVAVPELPFGGVGESGIGAYHGQAGFERFSHLSKPVRPDPPVLYPPYSRLKRWLLRRAV